jgi:hypothetical protein
MSSLASLSGLIAVNYQVDDSQIDTITRVTVILDNRLHSLHLTPLIRSLYISLHTQAIIKLALLLTQ